MSMDYATQEGKVQKWLLRVLSDLRVDLETPEFLSALWAEINHRFPEGYRLYGDQIFTDKTTDDLAVDAMQELADFFIYMSVMYDKMAPDG